MDPNERRRRGRPRETGDGLWRGTGGVWLKDGLMPVYVLQHERHEEQERKASFPLEGKRQDDDDDDDDDEPIFSLEGKGQDDDDDDDDDYYYYYYYEFRFL